MSSGGQFVLSADMSQAGRRKSLAFGTKPVRCLDFLNSQVVAGLLRVWSCFVVLGGANATDATRKMLAKSLLWFHSTSYEPGGREFESLRARQ